MPGTVLVLTEAQIKGATDVLDHIVSIDQDLHRAMDFTAVMTSNVHGLKAAGRITEEEFDAWERWIGIVNKQVREARGKCQPIWRAIKDRENEERDRQEGRNVG